MNLINQPIQWDKQEMAERHEITQLAAVRKKRGLTLFVLREGAVEEAKFDREEAILGMNGEVHRENRITVQKGEFFVQALNKRNAEKKLRKIGRL